MKTIVKNILAVCSMLAIALTSCSILAATQGTPGNPTSNGSIGVSLNSVNVIELSGLDDIVLSFVDSDGFEIKKQDKVCVFNNSAGGVYSVTATSSVGGTFFQVENISTMEKIDYGVTWNGEFLLSGILSPGFVGDIDPAHSGCMEGNTEGNADIEITMAEAQVLLQPAGLYTDILTLTVTMDP